MANISIGKAWEEAVAFIRREATLLFPVALLFVALPGLIVQEMTPPQLQEWFAQPKADAIPVMPPGFALSMLLGIVIIWFGSLALFALALRPGISVGEALRLSFSRLPVLLGTAVLVVVAIVAFIVVIALVSVIFAMASQQAAHAMGLLLGLAAVIIVFFASIRLVLLNAVVIDTRGGVVESLRRAWALTRGHFWRLFGFLVIVMLLSTLVGTAAQVIFGLLGSLLAGPEGARLAGGIAAAAVSAVVQVYLLVMLARIYRQASAA